MGDTVAVILSWAPLVVANLFLVSVVSIVLGLSVARIKADNLTDGVPGDVPQLLISGAVVVLLLGAVLGVPGALSIMQESSGAVATIIPLSLSPWLIYKGYKAKVSKDNTEVDVSKE